ncbi:MAG TPA: ATP-binding cassette domain-containing protein [Solirubrobacteraceae bacterium]
MSITELRGEALELRGGDEVILSGLDVVARAGESLAIHGPSASGKTSLLYALGGLAPLAGGRLEIDGRPAVPWRDARTGIVLQNLCLVPMLSAEETVALPMQSAGGAARGRSWRARVRRWSGSDLATTPRSWWARCRAGSASAWRSLAPWPAIPT